LIGIGTDCVALSEEGNDDGTAIVNDFGSLALASGFTRGDGADGKMEFTCGCLGFSITGGSLKYQIRGAERVYHSLLFCEAAR
jgi:hypothetical protein